MEDETNKMNKQKMDMADAIEVFVTFGLLEVKATLRINEEKVATVWYKQDPDVISNLAHFMKYALGGEE